MKTLAQFKSAYKSALNYNTRVRIFNKAMLNLHNAEQAAFLEWHALFIKNTPRP